MRGRFIAALALAMAVLGAPAVAQADPHQGHGDHIRYASAKGCPHKDGDQRPCGSWRLVLNSGRVELLKDAQLRPRDAKGRVNVYGTAPIAVSGNGQRVAYLRKDGRVAVRQHGGAAKLLVRDALPKGTDESGLTFELTDDGARLAVVSAGDRNWIRLFDTSTGASLGSLPKTDTFLGFSGDGEEVLTSGEIGEGVTGLNVYDTAGRRLRDGTPPQLVIANLPLGLHADGRTIAVPVNGKKLALYDLSSDQVAATFPIRLPKDTGVNTIDWTGDNQVTMHLIAYPADKPAKMTVVQIDTVTGAAKVRDSYSVLPDTMTFAACGG